MTDEAKTTETPEPSELTKALCAIRGEVGTVPKDGSGAHRVRYTTLDAMRAALRNPMAEHGVSDVVLRQDLEFREGGLVLHRVHEVRHVSGERITSSWTWPVPKAQDMQKAVLGATTTGTRYFLRDTFGLECGDPDEMSQSPGRPYHEEREPEAPYQRETYAPPAKKPEPVDPLMTEAVDLFNRLPEQAKMHPNGQGTVLGVARANKALPAFVTWAKQYFADLHAKPEPVEAEALADEAFA